VISKTLEEQEPTQHTRWTTRSMAAATGLSQSGHLTDLADGRHQAALSCPTVSDAARCTATSPDSKPTSTPGTEKIPGSLAACCQRINNSRQLLERRSSSGAGFLRVAG
jgi:hypothetical protein